MKSAPSPWRGVLYAALAAACVLATAPLRAQSPDVKRLTTDDRQNRDPIISETDLAAWLSYEKTEDATAQLMAFDGKSTRTIAKSSGKSLGSSRPCVQGDTITWLGTFVGNTGEEMRKRIDAANNGDAAGDSGASSTAESRLSGIVRWDRTKPNDPVLCNTPQVYALSAFGNLIAWQVERPFPFGWEIMAWDNGRILQLTTNNFYDMGPKVYGDQITWYGWDGYDFEIYLFDRKTMTTTQITSNRYDDIAPQIWNGEIVWEGYPAAESDIFLWKNGEIRKISDNIEDDFNPRIWEGQVVWQGFDGDDFEIYYYDGKSPQAVPFKITNNRYDDTNPEIGARFITWMGFEGNWDPEIYAMDKSGGAKSGSEIRITDNDEDDREPKVGRDCIIWQGRRGEKTDIFMATMK